MKNDGYDVNESVRIQTRMKSICVLDILLAFFSFVICKCEAGPDTAMNPDPDPAYGECPLQVRDVLLQIRVFNRSVYEDGVLFGHLVGSRRISLDLIGSFWIPLDQQPQAPYDSLGKVTATKAHQEHKHLHALQVPALPLQFCTHSRANNCCVLLVVLLRSFPRIPQHLGTCLVCALRKLLRGRLPSVHSGA